MSIRVEETNKELDRIVAQNLAKGDWDTATPSPAVALAAKDGKLATPGDTLTSLRKSV